MVPAPRKIGFVWLAGMYRPDHNTLKNSFVAIKRGFEISSKKRCGAPLKRIWWALYCMPSMVRKSLHGCPIAGDGTKRSCWRCWKNWTVKSLNWKNSWKKPASATRLMMHYPRNWESVRRCARKCAAHCTAWKKKTRRTCTQVMKMRVSCLARNKTETPLPTMGKR